MHPKVGDHFKPEIKKYNWGQPKKQVKQKFDKDGIPVPSKKIKDLRRKQFFNFVSDFFEKFDRGDMQGKASSLISFNEEEKEQWIKKYFKKYFMENAVLKDEVVRMKIDTDMAA